MSTAFATLGIDKLPLEERVALAEAIWDSVHLELGQAPESPELIQELQRRVAHYKAHPESGTPWEVVKARTLARLQS
jgi:putative addiction module component (TIGR02574 family)